MEHKNTFIITAFDEEKQRIVATDVRYTEKGYSDLANRYYNKYGENITVYVDKMNSNYELEKVCTYHA